MRLGERIGDANDAGILGVIARSPQVVGTNQRMRHDLVQAEAGQDAADVLARLGRIGTVRRERRARQPAGDERVPMRPSYLLRHVDRFDNVEPMRWHRHLPGLGPVRRVGHPELERSQQLLHAADADRNPEQALRARKLAANHAQRFRLRVVIDDPVCHRGPGDLRDQLRGAVGRVARHVPADPLLVAHARLRTQPEPACGVADCRPMEDGRLWK